MKENLSTNITKAKRKILPSLGGVSKNYIKKAHCLRKILLFLSEKIEELEFEKSLGKKEKGMLNKIKNDLIEVSKYEKKRKTEFYFKCYSIINHY